MEQKTKRARKNKESKNRISIEMTKVFIQIIDNRWKDLGYDSRNDFIRFAIRKYLNELGIYE